MTDPTELLSVPEAAQVLGITAGTLRRWTKSGRIARVEMPSGRKRYRRGDLEAILVPVEPTAAAS